MALGTILESIYNDITKTYNGGKPAPHLLHNVTNNDKFSLTVITVPGKYTPQSQIYEYGDTDYKVTIQSTIKPFINSLLLKRESERYRTPQVNPNLHEDILPGRRLYLPFDVTRSDMLQAIYQNNKYVSIFSIQNTGRLVPSLFQRDIVPPYLEQDVDLSWKYIQSFISECRGSTENLVLNQEIYRKEIKVLRERYRKDLESGSSQELQSFTLNQAIDLYSRQCSLMVTSRDCAELAYFLANCGVNIRGKRIISRSKVSRVLSSMFVGGLYETSGVLGLPAKSGIGGTLIVVVPGKMIISVISPKLDNYGNSKRGIQVCKIISERLGLGLFNC
jgi:glutaminase